jgi:quercetin 2,3-dioxygenase
MMKCLSIKSAGKVFPTGNPNFSVSQAFPSAFSAEQADPFLMCDHFGPEVSKGKIDDPDSFPVNWHPHRGMDIMTYLVQGVGRHADSLGNRGTYATPGMQWINVGSGIEHAEGGGTPAGMTTMGFQIWINTPKKFKMEDPQYGIETPDSIPVWIPERYPGIKARVLAGQVDDLVGPFKAKTDVQIVDLTVEDGKSGTLAISTNLDNCLVYVYQGTGTISGTFVSKGNVLLMDASNQQSRDIHFSGTSEGFSVIIFAGKRINEPIAWHGPFVMNTDEEIELAITEYRRGTFLKKRATWDYKRIATKPRSHNVEVKPQTLDNDQTNCL